MRKLSKIGNQYITFKDGFYNIYLCYVTLYERYNPNRELSPGNYPYSKEEFEERQYLVYHTDTFKSDEDDEEEGEWFGLFDKKDEDVEYDDSHDDFVDTEKKLFAVCTSKRNAYFFQKAYLFERFDAQGYQFLFKYSAGCGQMAYRYRHKKTKYEYEAYLEIEPVKMNDLFLEALEDWGQDYFPHNWERLERRDKSNYEWSF